MNKKKIVFIDRTIKPSHIFNNTFQTLANKDYPLTHWGEKINFLGKKKRKNRRKKTRRKVLSRIKFYSFDITSEPWFPQFPNRGSKHIVGLPRLLGNGNKENLTIKMTESLPRREFNSNLNPFHYAIQWNHFNDFNSKFQ